MNYKSTANLFYVTEEMNLIEIYLVLIKGIEIIDFLCLVFRQLEQDLKTRLLCALFRFDPFTYLMSKNSPFFKCYLNKNASQ